MATTSLIINTTVLLSVGSGLLKGDVVVAGSDQRSARGTMIVSQVVEQMDKLIAECEELRDVSLKQANDAIKVLNELG